MPPQRRTDRVTDDQDVPLNREQRRAQRRRAAVDKPQDNLRPQSLNNPTFGKKDVIADRGFGTPVTDARTGTPDQDQTDLTGPGTGGATESGERAIHHEGTTPNH
jgi:hypothetical protein